EKVLAHAEIGVQTERLGEVSGQLPRFARRPAEQLDRAGGRLHHAAQDLECRRLARAVWTDEAEDLTRTHIEIESANGLHDAVPLHEPSNTDGALHVSVSGARATRSRRRESRRRRACRAWRSPRRPAAGA